MSVNANLDLEIGRFKSKLAEARSQVSRTAGEMKRETRGIGEGMGAGFSKVGQMMSGLGAGVSVAGIAAGIKRSLEYADDLSDLSVKLNENAEALQRVDFAAKQTGAGGVEQMGNALIRLEKNLGDIDNKAAAEALARFGLSAETLMGMPIDQKVLALADAFQKARADGTGVADLMDLIGRSGGELIPLLAQTREQIQGLMDGATIISNRDIEMAAQLNDEFDALLDKATKWAMETGMSAAGIGGYIGTLLTEGKAAADNRLVENDIGANSRLADRIAQREEMAANMEAQRAAEAAAAQAARNADLREEADKARKRMEEQRISGLPDAAKLPALQGQLAGLFSRMLAGTGLEGQGKAGLARMIQGLDTDHGRARQIGFLEAMTEAERLEREIAGLKEKEAAAAKQAMEDALKASLGLKSAALAADQISARRGGSGAFQSMVDRVFGRSPTDSLLDENRTQTGVLRAIERKLDRLGQRDAARPVDVFAYP